MKNQGSTEIFTDGSKSDNGIVFAAVSSKKAIYYTRHSILSKYFLVKN